MYNYYFHIILIVSRLPPGKAHRRKFDNLDSDGFADFDSF